MGNSRRAHSAAALGRVLLCWAPLFVACETAPLVPDDTDAGARRDSAASSCSTDSECEDGVFCNGEERCTPSDPAADARGCVVAMGAVCAADEECMEDARECVTECAVERDADGDGHVAELCGGDDCDDADANRYPGNVEVCDGERHDEDCNPDTFGFLDADSDGSASSACCNGLNCGEDCNDGDSTVNPRAGDGPPLYCDGVDNDCSGLSDEGCPCAEGATRECGTDPQLMRVGICLPGTQICSGGAWTAMCVGGRAIDMEVCDTLDNDCDGTTDEGVELTYYQDGDGDGYGAPGMTRRACSVPAGWAPNDLDCDDSAIGVSPAATEVCNGRDDNCNAMTDEGLLRTFYADTDGDGFGNASAMMSACFAPAGYVTDATDCNDTTRSISPVAPEVCNAIDDNCDGSTDPGCMCTDGATRACGSSATGECMRGTQRCLSGGWGECVGNVEPRPEVCNGLDDNCNGTVDEMLRASPCYVDGDSDGYGAGASTSQCRDPARSAVGFCPVGYSNVATDCNDANASIRPGGTEACNGADDDCDRSIDEGVLITYYRDADRDGFGLTSGTRQGCVAPAGYVAASGDCADSDPSRYPGAPELCDGVDQNCTAGTTDEPTRTFYRDADSDLWGNAAITMTACSPPAGYVELAGDCNDTNPSIRPGAIEVCDGIDGDCDSSIDEPPAAAQCAGQNPFATGVSSWSCTSASCRPTCSTGLADCNASPIDGCEIDTRASALHCGGCGAACAPGATCSGSSCDTIVDIGAGASTSCVVWSSGTLTCWGDNAFGQQARLPLTEDSLTPAPVSAIVSADRVHMGPQSQQACVTGGGLLQCWGGNGFGQVGDGTKTTPRLMPFPSYSSTPHDASVGAYHTCLITPAGIPTRQVRCWGWNVFGQLGEDSDMYPEVLSYAMTPGSATTSGASVAAGFTHTCMARTDGGARCWGTGGYGELGNGTTPISSDTPVIVSSVSDFTQVSAGESFTCGLRSDGRAACWGSGADGRLGSGSTADRSTPFTHTGTPRYTELCAGEDFACGLTSTGSLYCWGDNGDNVVASSGADRLTPVFRASGVQQVACGGRHACYVRNQREVYCWGSNAQGATGLGLSTGTTISPTRVF